MNLSLALAKLGRRVVLMDADLGLANVDVLLGIEAKKKYCGWRAENAHLPM